jgi:hypothetical protein
MWLTTSVHTPARGAQGLRNSKARSWMPLKRNITDYGCAIGIYLCFEVETGGVTILPDLSGLENGPAQAMANNFNLKQDPPKGGFLIDSTIYNICN